MRTWAVLGQVLELPSSPLLEWGVEMWGIMAKQDLVPGAGRDSADSAWAEPGWVGLKLL